MVQKFKLRQNYLSSKYYNIIYKSILAIPPGVARAK